MSKKKKILLTFVCLALVLLNVLILKHRLPSGGTIEFKMYCLMHLIHYKFIIALKIFLVRNQVARCIMKNLKMMSMQSYPLL